MGSGYADVNGIKLYHEIYGEGEPLVLIRGGLTTVPRIVGKFLADPLANPPAGAAAASQVAPPPEKKQ